MLGLLGRERRALKAASRLAGGRSQFSERSRNPRNTGKRQRNSQDHARVQNRASVMQRIKAEMARANDADA